MKLKPTQFIIFSIFLLISPITAFKVLSTTNTTQQDGHDQGDYLEKNNQWQYYFKNLSGCGFGDEAQGLAKLKQYFHQFGYIDEGRHGLINNFSDVFDSPLQYALKTYQTNFNLPVSGALDAATLSQLLRPRCGVPDIINGSSTMKSGKPTSADHSSSLHSTAHFSFFPGEPRWPPYKQSLTYAFFPGNNLSEPVKAVFRRAFSRWAAVTPLTFSEADSYLEADMKIGFFVGEHGDGEPFDGVLGTLAHAFSPPDGRFHLDGAEEWAVEGERGVDLESVAVHEIGHLLGLGHSSVEEAIMFPTISSRRRKVELARDDVEGIQVLYGENPRGGVVAPAAPTSQERERSSDESGGWRWRGGGWWWGVGLLGWGS
ncbi:hypothetical protein Scep_021519 [Stephania cephalantha]|uniref:Peptidase metallopeptidase domain-containing protein n=1 Tax=Stephania cephalantha TaxID=152367 RepID=A0AAP0F671_9MAGN